MNYRRLGGGGIQPAVVKNIGTLSLYFYINIRCLCSKWLFGPAGYSLYSLKAKKDRFVTLLSYMIRSCLSVVSYSTDMTGGV